MKLWQGSARMQPKVAAWYHASPMVHEFGHSAWSRGWLMGADYETRGTEERMHPTVHGPFECLGTCRADCHVRRSERLQLALCYSDVYCDTYPASTSCTRNANVCTSSETPDWAGLQMHACHFLAKVLTQVGNKQGSVCVSGWFGFNFAALAIP